MLSSSSTTAGSRRPRKRSTPVAAATALALAVATVSPAGAAAPSRVALPSPNAPSTTDQGATTAPLDPTLQLSLRVYLAPRPGLATAAATVSDPGGPAYAHYLTPAQYQRWYAPTAAQTTRVTAWLTAQGMTITADNPHYIAVTATVAQADAAFATQVSEYDTIFALPGGGSFTVRAPGVVGGFSVPAALGDDIASVTGIDQIVLPNASSAAARARGSRTAKRSATPSTSATAFQCSQYWGQYTAQIPTAFGHTTALTQLCGYTPNQIRQAYGVATSAYTGKGATIAIISTGYKPLMAADASRYFASHGEAGFAPGQFTDDIGPTVDSTCAGIDPEPDPEEPIDVESAHIAAPDAKIVNVATDCNQTGNTGAFLQIALDGVTRVVDKHLADIVSGSFGIPEPFDAPADMAAWDPVLQQGALEGIGFDFSSGDSGDLVGDPTVPQDYNLHNAQFPATDPWVTAVGGTSLAIGRHGAAVGEYVWGDNFATINSAGTGYTPAPPGTYFGGSGGGVSSLYAEPGYQKRVVPAALATDNGTAPASRVMPDISADAGIPWLVGWTGALTDGTYTELPAGGGTSASAPLIAGLEADAIQAAGHPLGFANPALYCLRGSTAIRDILPVSPADPPILLGDQTSYAGIDTTQLTTLGEDATLTVTPGYDDATGLGAATPSFVTGLAAR